MAAEPAKKFKFIGCEVIYREACHLASASPHQVDLQFLQKGLHDLETPDMTARIQSAIDEVTAADGYDAILLGYARCNDGLVGVRAGELPLVIPRAHDCISFFFGSPAAYADYFSENPGTYYMTTGWAERNNSPDGSLAQLAYGQDGVMAKLGLADSYEQLVEKYGKDSADYIKQTLGDWRDHYSRLMYFKMGVCDETQFIGRAQANAETNGWEFILRDGDWSLLRKLFWGNWDDDLLVIQPGQQIIARNDGAILGSADGA